MENDWSDFILGAVAGLMIGFVGHSATMPDKEACAKANDVYRCEWVAVPVKGE